VQVCSCATATCPDAFLGDVPRKGPVPANYFGEAGDAAYALVHLKVHEPRAIPVRNRASRVHY